MGAYSLSELQEKIAGTLIGEGDQKVRHLAIDSRLEHPFKDTLFIALKGLRHDGHTHINELIKKGVRNFLVSSLPSAPDPDVNFLLVSDTQVALQAIGLFHRQAFDIPVVGITGSNGKTIVKEWLNQLLKEDKHIVRSPGSWNSQLGVPMSVWNMDKEHELALFEAGISRPKEMAQLAKIIAPNIGIFTTIGPAHDEGFASVNEKAQEKAILFKNDCTVIYCADNQRISEALDAQGIDLSFRKSWSRKQEGFVQLLHEEHGTLHTRIQVKFNAEEHTLALPFSDDASIENAMHCICCALVLGVSINELKERVPLLKPLAMRLEVLEGIAGATLLNDTYSNDLASLKIALSQLNKVAGSRNKAVILSDMVDTGVAPETLYKQVRLLLIQAGISRGFFIGDTISKHLEFENARYFENKDTLLSNIDEQELSNTAVLIKGARIFELETVTKQLQEKNHGTVLEIDLAAIKNNLEVYRNKLHNKTKVMVMLKAFGYGSGAPELARLLEYERVSYLGVAYANEGIQLRQEGISTPILVMNASDVSWNTFERFKLQPTIHNLTQLKSFLLHFNDLAVAPPIHIELDTGMHRLGFRKHETPALFKLLSSNKSLKIASVFSHLAGSDSEEHDVFTKQQIQSFDALSKAVLECNNGQALRHILNSSGISRHTYAQYDMVRLGIGIYGYDQSETALNGALSLSAGISQIKEIAAGESIGYDRSFIAESDTRIAILPLGYADGLRRSLSNKRGQVWINNHSAPILGKVCMDMCMVDVTHVNCAVGDRAVLFNAQHSLSDLAKAMNTIPYEVLTSLSPRIERRYVREA